MMISDDFEFRRLSFNFNWYDFDIKKMVEIQKWNCYWLTFVFNSFLIKILIIISFKFYIIILRIIIKISTII